MLFYNLLEEWGCESFTSDFFLVEKFQNSYKQWGYPMEILFRIVTVAIAWRAHQFALYHQRIF
jgi:hypothetical protein